MNNEHDKKPIKEQVLEAITSGRTKMRPKWHFVLKSTLLITGSVIFFLALLYLVSFILFSLRQTGILFAPMFGSRGWFVFFRSLPWLLILLSAFFIIILEILVRRYSFAYRNPLLYSVLGILFAVFIGGGLISPWHRGFFRAARENRLPFAGHFYRNFGMQRFGDVHRGQITGPTENGFLFEDFRGETSTIVITPETRIPSGIDLKPGDTVVIFGDDIAGEIRAYGVQRISGSE